MSVKAFIFLFPILFLLLIPVTAEEEPLNINIEFSEFYEVNISSVLAKNIGVAGLGYHPTVTVSSTTKEVDLTERTLEVTFNYDGFNPRNLPIFGYEGHFYRNVTFPISFRLADELKNGDRDSFQFEIFLVKPGSYWVECVEIVDGKRMVGSGMRIQIIEPYEWENIIKQADLIKAENMSAEASKSTSIWTKRLAILTAILASVTAILAGGTWWMARVSRRTLDQMQKELIYDVLAKLLMEYRKPQMFSAVNRLWQFHKECKKAKKELVDEYKKIYNSEKEKIDSMDKQKQLEALKTTLDNQRRLVSQFYGLLADLWADGILPENIIFESWNRETLEIIPLILIPMENKLREMEGPPIDEKSNLRKLYEASKAHEASKDG